LITITFRYWHGTSALAVGRRPIDFDGAMGGGEVKEDKDKKEKDAIADHDGTG
jgi:hypothetical protein